MEDSGALQAIEWVDTHCHLDSLESPPDEAVSSAQSAGVSEIITVGTDLSSSAASVELAGRFPSVHAVVGIHPHDARHADDQALQEIQELASAPQVVAVGEIGLDFFRDLSPRDLQIQAFERQLDIAARLHKPVVLHIRDAHPEAFEVLTSADYTAGLIFHCFSAGPDEARKAVDLGGYVSFAGNISYRKSESIQEAARCVPMERILVETDAPYLAPVPYRGKPNHPGLLPEVGKAVAQAIGCSVGQLAKNTRANVGRIFGF